MSELRNIPNVGKQTERDLTAMGYTTIDSLRSRVYRMSALPLRMHRLS